jgi:uncharacterized membrane protein
MTIPKWTSAIALGAALIVAALRRRHRATIVHKTITVDAPIDRVFDVWSRLDNFPLLMENVRAVIVEGKRALWRVEGPAGTVVEYESEVTKLEPDRVIEWQSSSRHRGRVWFEEIEGGTRVHVEMT